MCTDIHGSMSIGRSLLRLAIAAMGVVSIVGSGGGGDFCFDNCPPNPVPPLFPSLDPTRVTAQVGGTVVYTVSAPDAVNPSYSWCRQPADGTPCADIPGATGPTYTLDGVNLTDDGARFTATVSAANGFGRTNASTLAVSSMPGVVYQDADFLDSNWAATAITTPLQDGPTHDESRSTTGGNPAAFRRMTFTVPSAPSSVQIFHTALSASYDPTVQGAIYVIDFAQDCIFANAGTLPYIVPMLEQAGRRFVAAFRNDELSWFCASSAWEAMTPVSSLGQQDFVLADGAACSVGEMCPDFSASAAPIRLGYSSGYPGIAQSGSGTWVYGIDNWKVTVWRR